MDHPKLQITKVVAGDDQKFHCVDSGLFEVASLHMPSWPPT